MALIKKNISVFKKLFMKKLEKKESSNSFFAEEMPNYMMIIDNTKEKLLYNLSLIKKLLCENNAILMEKEEIEFFNSIKRSINLDKELNRKINEFNDEIEKLFNIDFIKLVVKGEDEKTKKDVFVKYQRIIKRNAEFNNFINEIDKISKKISNKKISIVVENRIENEMSIISNDKNIIDNLNEKISNFNKNMYDIIDNADISVLKETINDYKIINYVTLSTIIIDESIKKYSKLEDDFKNHRFNKFYYERETSKIKRELNKLKNIKSRKEIVDHINKLKKDLYTKSKDKYDLLYNNEVFMFVEKECDDLLNKLNAKVIDIKKDNTEKENKKSKNISLRFADMALARELIINNQDINIKNEVDLEKYINTIYNDFCKEKDYSFNFPRNMYKMELVILYNEINSIIGWIKKEPYILINHINFRLNDLIEAIEVRKDELNNLIIKKNMIIDDNLVNLKINSMKKNKKK